MGAISFPWLPRQFARPGKEPLRIGAQNRRREMPGADRARNKRPGHPAETGAQALRVGPRSEATGHVEGGDHFLFGSAGEKFVSGMVNFIRASVARAEVVSSKRTELILPH